MQPTTRLATLDDLISQTATNPALLPGVKSIAVDIANAIIIECASTLGVKTQQLPCEEPIQYRDQSEIEPDSLILDIGSRKLGIQCRALIPISIWTTLAIRFFGGDSLPAGGTQPIQDVGAGKALLQKYEKAVATSVERLLENWTRKTSKRPIDSGVGSRYLEARIQAKVDGIDLPLLVQIPSSFINSYWADLRPSASENRKNISRASFADPLDVDYQTQAFIEISDYSLERIIAPTGDQMLVLGDASEILVRLRLDESQIYEGKLIEKDGKYAVEIIA